jgi:glycopeptide antibiotics resistance protein
MADRAEVSGHMWQFLDRAGWLGQDVFVVACITLTVVLAINLARRRLRRARDRRHALARSFLDSALIGALALIVAMTLLPTHSWEVTRASMFDGAVNLVPLDTIRPMLNFGSPAQQSHNLINNILLFVPLGWAVALKSRTRAPVVVATMVGSVVSALVEYGQWALPLVRSSDVDDVLLNTAGALIGALGAVVVLPALRWAAHSRRKTAPA